MVGSKNNVPLPEPANYIGNSHYWVCEGAIESITNQIVFFTENQPNGAGSFTQGMYTINSPGTVGGIVTRQFYMNWGQGGTDNGWYSDNNLPTSNNYQYSRQDIFVSH